MDDIAEISDESVAEQEESKGLFGFIGKMFSSDEDDTTATEDVSEESIEQLALADPDIEETQLVSEESLATSLDDELIVDEGIPSIRALATQGDIDAQYQLGTQYYSGTEVQQDYSQAALWYRRAAQQGNIDAQYSLGNMYLMGEGVDQDDQQAAYWYALAADQGHNSAKNNLANLQKTFSDEIEIDTEVPPPSEERLAIIDDDINETGEPYDPTGKTAYERGLAFAFGDGVPQNDRDAFNNFLEAAEKGYALAQYKVGVAYAYGEGVRQDDRKAAEWYRKAAEQGYVIAQRNLANMYLNGSGIEQDKVQALAWYQIVATAGNAMDIRRRDLLQQELTDIERSESVELAKQISDRLSNNASL